MEELASRGRHLGSLHLGREGSASGGSASREDGQNPPPPPRRYTGYYRIRSTHGRSTSYSNAFLFKIKNILKGMIKGECIHRV